MQAKYDGGGVNLNRSGSSWAFRTAPDLSDFLNKEIEVARKLSRAAIETLAIVAYHQPVTRAEIEEIRGVSVSTGTLDVLLETGWVKMRGRRKVPGRPLTYGTSEDFLVHFGLETLRDLPGVDDLKAAGREQSTLNLAATHALSYTFVPRWLIAIGGPAQIGTLNLVSDTHLQCVRLMKSGAVSFFISHSSPAGADDLPERQIMRHLTGRDGLVPLCAPRPGGRPRWTLGTEASGVPFIAYAAASGLHAILEAHWAGNGRPGLAPAMNSVLAATNLAMAKEGQGVAFLPHSLAEGDIGQHFPPSKAEWKGAASDIFLKHAIELARSKGFELANCDVTLICEQPKIGPHAGAMRAELARTMSVDPDRVSVKATTSERLGFTGREEGIASQAVATLVRA